MKPTGKCTCIDIYKLYTNAVFLAMLLVEIYRPLGWREGLLSGLWELSYRQGLAAAFLKPQVVRSNSLHEFCLCLIDQYFPLSIADFLWSKSHDIVFPLFASCKTRSAWSLLDFSCLFDDKPSLSSWHLKNAWRQEEKICSIRLEKWLRLGIVVFWYLASARNHSRLKAKGTAVCLEGQLSSMCKWGNTCKLIFMQFSSYPQLFQRKKSMAFIAYRLPAQATTLDLKTSFWGSPIWQYTLVAIASMLEACLVEAQADRLHTCLKQSFGTSFVTGRWEIKSLSFSIQCKLNPRSHGNRRGWQKRGVPHLSFAQHQSTRLQSPPQERGLTHS